MSHLLKLNRWDNAGYDASRNLQVLPVSESTTFYLVAGGDLDVHVDDPACVDVKAGLTDDKQAHKSADLSGWEKSQIIRKVILVGKTRGVTKLRATLNGADWISPVTVSVTSDSNWRQVGKAPGEASEQLRSELKSLSLRQAVLRVAEDQMHSAIASRKDGFGDYHANASYDWCGAFAHWCWAQACRLKKKSNPFGDDSNVLLSPQKAIAWAMREDSPGQLLRYKGINPMTGKGMQEYREIGYAGYQLEPADIVLLREGTATGWKHVCMVYQGKGSAIQTIDGNQGKFQSIKIVNRSLTEKLGDGSYKLVFVHVLGV